MVGFWVVWDLKLSLVEWTQQPNIPPYLPFWMNWRTRQTIDFDIFCRGIKILESWIVTCALSNGNEIQPPDECRTCSPTQVDIMLEQTIWSPWCFHSMQNNTIIWIQVMKCCLLKSFLCRIKNVDLPYFDPNPYCSYLKHTTKPLVVAATSTKYRWAASSWKLEMKLINNFFGVPTGILLSSGLPETTSFKFLVGKSTISNYLSQY